MKVVLTIGTMQEPQFNLEEKETPSILKDDFSLRTDPSIFTSIPPELLDRSNESMFIFSILKINKLLLAPINSV